MFLGCFWRNTKDCLLKNDFAFGVLVFGFFNLILWRRSQSEWGCHLPLKFLWSYVFCYYPGSSCLLFSSVYFLLFSLFLVFFFNFHSCRVYELSNITAEFSCYFKTLAQNFGKLVGVWHWILHSARTDTGKWGMVFSTMQITVNVH